MTKNILVIGDAHAHPDVDNRRFDWLGKFILDRRPDIIVDIGDWADMPSLSYYDKGKAAFEHRRYLKDCEAAKDASERAFGPLRDLQIRQKIAKRKIYKPDIYRILGNHDGDRIARIGENSPELEGIFKIDDLGYGDFDEIVKPFLEPTVIEGIVFSHYFYRQMKSYPINNASALIKEYHTSCVCGHDHKFDYSQATTSRGQRLQAVFVGCFLDPDDYASNFAGPQARMRWWSGLTMLNNTRNGQFDLEMISANRLKDIYKGSH